LAFFQHFGIGLADVFAVLNPYPPLSLAVTIQFNQGDSHESAERAIQLQDQKNGASRPAQKFL
jgi:hypothetical protein